MDTVRPTVEEEAPSRTPTVPNKGWVVLVERGRSDKTDTTLRDPDTRIEGSYGGTLCDGLLDPDDQRPTDTPGVTTDHGLLFRRPD